MVIIRNALALAGKVRIRFSPIMELSLALGVLEAPDHHPDQEAWAEAWEREAGTPEKSDFLALGKRIVTWSRLDEYLRLDKETFDEQGFGSGPRSFFATPDVWRKKGGAVLGEGEAGRYALFLERFWDKYMAPFIKAESGSLVRSLREDRVCLENGGDLSYLRSISERIRRKGRGGTELVLETGVDLELDAEKLDELAVYASAFASPHLVVTTTLVPFRRLGVSRDLGKPEAPEGRGLPDIAALAFALSDPGRLRMLMMCGKPLSQTELGDRMGLAKSTISRHVGLLVESGALERVQGPDGESLLVANAARIKGFSPDALGLLGLS